MTHEFVEGFGGGDDVIVFLHSGLGFNLDTGLGCSLFHLGQSGHQPDELKLAVAVEVEIMPKTLNLASNGNWISCIIELGEEYDIADVDMDSITLNETVKPVWSKADNKTKKLLVKFGRLETKNLLSAVGNPAAISIRGKFNDGTDFEGADTIRIKL